MATLQKLKHFTEEIHNLFFFNQSIKQQKLVVASFRQPSSLLHTPPAL